jgi:hypothetical protein
VGIFSRQHNHQTAPAPAPASPAPIDLNSLIETLLVKAVDSQVGLYERITRLTNENLQLALDRNRRSQKRIAGATRARAASRNGRGQMVQCRLCHNPAIFDPTPAEIIAHQSHRAPAPRPPDEPPEPDTPEFPYTVRDGAVHVDVPESAVQTDAQGNEVLECAGCAKGEPGHVHQVH